MQNILKITFFLLLTQSGLLAQQLEGGLIGGFGIASSRVAFRDDPTITSDQGKISIGGSISTQLLVQLGKSRFHLGVSVDHMETTQEFLIDNSDSQGNIWRGTYQNRQIGFQIIPEIRLFKNNLAYVQAGIGFIADRGSSVIEGKFFNSTLSGQDITGQRWNPILREFIALGVGVRPIISERSRLLAGIRYMLPNKLYTDEFQAVDMPFNYFLIQLGLCTKL
jgi:hypothetical protein